MDDTKLIPDIEEVNKALDEIRPHLITDGGDIRVLEVTDGFDIKVQFLGNCQSCTLAGMTLSNGVEYVLRSKFPGLRQVVAVKEASK